MDRAPKGFPKHEHLSPMVAANILPKIVMCLDVWFLRVYSLPPAHDPLVHSNGLVAKQCPFMYLVHLSIFCFVLLFFVKDSKVQ